MTRSITLRAFSAVNRPALALLAGAVISVGVGATAQPTARATQTREFTLTLTNVAIGAASRQGGYPVIVGIVIDNRLQNDLLIASAGVGPELHPSRGGCGIGEMSLPVAQMPRTPREPGAWSQFVRVQSGSTHGAGIRFRFTCDRDALGASAQLTFRMTLAVMQGEEPPAGTVTVAPTITGIELVQR